jgi:hypothetical protein
MKRHSTERHTTIFWLLVLSVALVGALSGIAFAATRSDGDVDPNAPPNKQTAERDILDQQATAEAGVLATKPVDVTLPSSCPPVLTPGIYPLDQGRGIPPFHQAFAGVSDVGVISTTGQPYAIYTGAAKADPSQGVLLVRKLLDPCVDIAAADAAQFQWILTPFQRGAVTATGVEGDVLLLALGDGSSASYNYVSGVFDVSGQEPPVVPASVTSTSP